MVTTKHGQKEIKDILRNALDEDGWDIDRPRKGMSKETYIAKSAKRIVFVKFGVNIPPLLRLNELGLTPKVIAWGMLQEESFVIQEFIDGQTPNRVWFEQHILQLADFIKRYHTDIKLYVLISEKSEFDFQQHVKADVEDLEKQITKADSYLYKKTKFVKFFHEFKKRSYALPVIKPVPIHADPNVNNFIVSNGLIYLLDWDDILLSDPLRDMGLVLWWYVPKRLWGTFFDRHGMRDDPRTEERLFWWCAARSLAISLWFLLNKQDSKSASAYLIDFYTAMDKAENKNFSH